jgi:hypothetical protein
MTITVNYQFKFSSLTFGGAGSPYQIQSVDGLESLPAIRNQDDNRGYADGMFSGQDFLGGRNISMMINTFATSGGASAQTNYNTLQSLLLPQVSGTTPLYFLIPSSGSVEQYVNARVRSVKTAIDPNYTYGYITSLVEFFCPDSRYYNSTQLSASLTIGNALGRPYNRIYPLVYTYGLSAGTTSIANAGWATTYPTITITGPISNPIVGNATTGQYINISGTYANTDTIIIDLYNKLITLNGTSARNLITGNSEWFGAPAGTSQFYYTGTGTSGITTATVTWYSAFI